MKSGRFSDSLIAATVVIAVALLCVGCGEYTPETTTAGGTITYRGKPLANAEVRFVPMNELTGGNYIARGVSDEEGKFVLRFPGREESGVCLGENKVMVLEGPMPDESRGQSEEAQQIASEFARTLKNRPIPSMFASLSDSPLSFEVTPDRSQYDIDLSEAQKSAAN